jgi:IS30 family transposase
LFLIMNISRRPPEADDRAVPGHWEGDLLIGRRNATAIATLVERTTGYTMLVPLPDGYKPEHVAPALTTKIKTLPEGLCHASACARGRLAAGQFEGRVRLRSVPSSFRQMTRASM